MRRMRRTGRVRRVAVSHGVPSRSRPAPEGARHMLPSSAASCRDQRTSPSVSSFSVSWSRSRRFRNRLRSDSSCCMPGDCSHRSAGETRAAVETTVLAGHPAGSLRGPGRDDDAAPTLRQSRFIRPISRLASRRFPAAAKRERPDAMRATSDIGNGLAADQ